jgi:hypothetical protein
MQAGGADEITIKQCDRQIEAIFINATELN